MGDSEKREAWCGLTLANPLDPIPPPSLRKAECSSLILNTLNILSALYFYTNEEEREGGKKKKKTLGDKLLVSHFTNTPPFTFILPMFWFSACDVRKWKSVEKDPKRGKGGSGGRGRDLLKAKKRKEEWEIQLDKNIWGKKRLNTFFPPT